MKSDEMVSEVSRDAPAWVVERLRVAYDDLREHGARVHGEHTTLTPQVFRAFKDLGRRDDGTTQGPARRPAVSWWFLSAVLL